MSICEIFWGLCLSMSKFALLFVLVFFGGVIASFFYAGSASFVLYQLVYFLNPGNRWWSAGIPDLRYSFVTVVVMLVVFMVRYRDYNQASPWKEQKCFKWMMLLPFAYVGSSLVALDSFGHKAATFEFSKMVVIMLFAYKVIDSKRAFDVVVWAYVVGVFYIGYLAFVSGRDPFGRVEGIGMVDAPDANDTAAAMVPAVVLLMFLAWDGGKYHKFLAALMGAVIVNGLVLINSRGSFLGVLASMGLFLLYMVFSKYQKKGQRTTAILVVILGVGGAYYLTDDVFWQRMETLRSEEGSESGAERTELWWITFDMMEDYPFGLGVNGYNQVAPLYVPEEVRRGVYNKSVHSSWFQAISEIGYHGLALFVIMMVALARQARAAKRYLISLGDNRGYFKVVAIECALVGYLVPATFINRFRAEILYWMILFLALAIKFYYLQPQQKHLQDKRTSNSTRLSTRTVSKSTRLR